VPGGRTLLSEISVLLRNKGPEFNPQYWQKKKKGKTGKVGCDGMHL
jgi:hypothetical protein